jgi:hypothetical protein
MNPDREQEQFMMGFSGLESEDSISKAEVSQTAQELKDNPLDLENPMGDTPASGAPMSLGGILGRGN